jgi:hypothetical protein
MKKERKIEDVKRLIRQGTNPLVAVYKYYHSSNLHSEYKQIDIIKVGHDDLHYEQVDITNPRDRERCICFCEKDGSDKVTVTS